MKKHKIEKGDTIKFGRVRFRVAKMRNKFSLNEAQVEDEPDLEDDRNS